MRPRLSSLLAPVLFLVVSLSLVACADPTTALQSQRAPTVQPTLGPPTTALQPQRAPAVQPTLSPPPTEYLPPYGCLPAITIIDVVVQACMNNPNPAQYDTLMITTRMSVGGMPVAEAPVKTTWYHSTGRQECLTTSNSEGIGFCSRNIGNDTINFRVVVEVQYDYNGIGHRGETSFTPVGPAVSNPGIPLPTTAPTAPARPVPTVAPPANSPQEPSKRGQLTYQAPGCNIKGNVAFDNGERIYHVPGGKYYNSTVIDARYGERWFCNEQDAVNNGWRKSKF
jgi:hypothetical protein